MTGTVIKDKIIREDLNLYTGKTTVATRLDSTAGTITGTAVGDTVDILSVYGGSKTDATIQDAVTTIGTSDVTISLTPGTWTISNDVTIPNNIGVYIPNGVTLDIASGKTLTIKGPVKTDSSDVSSGSGTLTMYDVNDHVGTVAYLRELVAPTANGVTKTTLGCLSAGDGGGGSWRWVTTGPDSTAADNTGTHVLPTAHVGAGRWVRQYSGYLQPEWFGAVADGSTDDSTPINAALAVGDITLSAGKQYAIESAITIDGDNVCIAGDGAEVIGNGTSNVFTFSSSSSARFCNIHVGKITNNAGSGHVVEFDDAANTTSCSITIDYVSNASTSSSTIYTNIVSSGGVYDNRIIGLFWQTVSGVTASPIKVTADSGRFNDNYFSIKRITSSVANTLPLAVDIQCTSSGTYLYHNVFEDINFQNPVNGCFRLAGTLNAVLRNIWSWDSGTITGDQILLTNDGASGLNATRTVIENYHRTKGTLSGGAVDINLANAAETVIHSCGGPATAGITIDANNSRAIIFDAGINTTINNASTATTTVIYSSSSDSQIPVFTTRKLKFNRGGTEVIASGAITAAESFIVVDTEGAAASDDLDTINGGEDGFILVLCPLAASKVVTVKHNTGNIRLNGGSDMVLDNARHTLTLMYSSVPAAWIEISRSEAV